MDQKQYPKPHTPTATILSVIIAVGVIVGGAYAYEKFILDKPQEQPASLTGGDENTIRSNVENYIRNNISNLSEEKAVLGGTFYVTKIIFFDSGRALVNYEDGHIALVALTKYSVGNDQKVNITSFKNLSGNFERTGNLTKDNPGQKANTWYLVYEKTGQPGLSAELVFNQDSVCVNGDSAELCRPSEFKTGDRVKVTGQLTGNKLDVMTMTTVE